MSSRAHLCVDCWPYPDSRPRGSDVFATSRITPARCGRLQRHSCTLLPVGLAITWGHVLGGIRAAPRRRAVFVALAAGLVGLHASAAFAVAPSNDDIASATALTTTPIPGTNVG